MNKIKNSKIKLRYFAIITVIVIIVLVIPICINECYKVERGYVTTVWKGSDLLSFYGNLLSFCGTVLLGALALWQNFKFKRENDLAQKRLEELNKSANSINDRALKIEENKQRPYIDFENGLLTDTTFIELWNDKNNGMLVRVYLKNISNVVAKRCDLLEAELFFTNKCYKLSNIENDTQIFSRRSAIPNEKLYYHFYCVEDVNEDKVSKMNNFFEKNAPGKVNGKAITDKMYIIELKFKIVDLVDNEYYQKIWCFFRQDISKEEKYTMWNRILEL